MSDTLHTGNVIRIEQLTPSTLGVHCTCENMFDFEAGQYVELSFPPLDDEERQFWPMALASGPQDDAILFTIRQSETSRVMPYLRKLEVGQSVHMKGPKGSGLYASKANRKIGMIATGTGFAPMRSILQSSVFQERNHETIILLGVDHQEEILFASELDAQSNVTLIPVLYQPKEGWTGETGWVTDVLESKTELFDWEQTDFYLCGQRAMTEKAKELLLNYGVQEEAIKKA